jgi:gamma-glutamyl hydrolase
MGQHFNVLATEKDNEDRIHVAIYEGKDHPIFAVQFHPEKPMFEFAKTRAQQNIPHTVDSIRVGQYLANRFVESARRNFHCFDSHAELDQLLIYNHKPEYVGNLPPNRFEQIYLFPLKEF